MRRPIKEKVYLASARAVVSTMYIFAVLAIKFEDKINDSR